MFIKKRAFFSLVPPALLVILFWIVQVLQWGMEWDFSEGGIFPRSLQGAWGIITSAFIHGGFKHLFANSSAFLLLGWLLYYFYKEIANGVLLFLWLGSGLLTWIIGRPAWHIGASGVIYALAFFLFFSGVFRKNSRLAAIALIVVFLYGSMLWNMFPIAEIVDPKVSWEGHLSGAITGLVAAVLFRKKGPQPDPLPADDEEEDSETDEEPYWKKPSDDNP
ncbi:MAG: rhomboid family intramembrane serine protease [Bacteroidales bacterium]